LTLFKASLGVWVKSKQTGPMNPLSVFHKFAIVKCATMWHHINRAKQLEAVVALSVGRKIMTRCDYPWLGMTATVNQCTAGVKINETINCHECQNVALFTL